MASEMMAPIVAEAEKASDESVGPSTNSVASDEVSVEVEDVGFQDILLLQDHGVDVKDIKELQAAGINTVKGFQMTMMKRLLCINGFNDAKIAKVKEACGKVSMSTGFVTALEISDQRKQVFKLSTGSKNLDKLLGGGIESMSITEVFGEFGTGKTQLAYTLCVMSQIPGGNGYTGGKVIFIDTEHTFRPERLQAIANRFNLDSTTVLENVVCARAYTSEHQYELLNTAASILHEEAGLYKLLIVDSIMALFRVDFSGRREMADRQQKLGQMMSRLQKISEEYNVAVFITNQVTSDLTNPHHLDAQKPVGGNILAHASTTRISLRKAEDGRRIAKIYDSPELAENETMFAITPGGIDDIAD